jgi:hypothetical protein
VHAAAPIGRAAAAEVNAVRPGRGGDVRAARGGRRLRRALAIACLSALAGCGDDGEGGRVLREFLYGPQDNQLDVYDLAAGTREVLIPSSQNHVNGQVCALPDGSGRFVVGEDTGQPVVRAGWGIFSADGTQLLQKIPVPPRPGETDAPEPYGCAFDGEARLFLSEIGDQSLTAANGQLLVFFPPDYETSCLIDGAVHVAGTVAVDAANRVYVPEIGGVLRYAPPFPRDARECGTVAAVKADFIRYPGVNAVLGAAQGPNGHWYVSIVFALPGGPTIKEHAEDGTFIRDLIPPGTGGTPAGLAVGEDGTVYYADLAIGPNQSPIPNAGTVRRIRFDPAGLPQTPEILGQGLDFPDAVSIVLR